MSSISQILDHTAQAKARLLQQYKDKPRLNAVLAAYVDQIQEVEDALYPVIAARMLDSATGSTLDAIGTYFNVARQGLNDADYRNVIYGTIAVQSSDTTVETLLNCVLKLFGASQVFIGHANSIGEAAVLPTAVVTLGAGGPTVSPAIYGYLVGLLQQALPAGVVLSEFFTFPDTGVFAMDGPQPWVAGFDTGVFATDVYQNITA